MGIFVSPPSPCSLALGLPCQCCANHPITTSLRTEPEKQPSHLTPAVPVPHWGSTAGFRCCRVCVAFSSQHQITGKAITTLLSRKTAQVPIHQPPKGLEMTAKSQGLLLKEQKLFSRLDNSIICLSAPARETTSKKRW